MKTAILKITLCALFLASSNLAFAQKNTKELKEVYDFDYIYKLKMTHTKDDIQFDYYLKNDVEYFGFLMPMMSKNKDGMEMFTVMDTENKVTAMFMEVMGRKIVQKTKIKLDDFDADNDVSDYTIKEIGSKTILGYDCQGFVMENKDTELTFYITDKAPVSFNKIWDNNGKTKMPKGFNSAWMKKYSENGLMMEMQYVDKKKSKNNVTMTCIAIDKTDFSIQTSSYGSLLGGFGG